MRRSKAQWRALIASQQSSGLTAAEYCRQHNVNAKYFSRLKSELGRQSSEFVRMTPAVSRVSTPPSPSPPSRGIKLRVIEVELPLQESSQSDTLPLLLDRLLR